MSAGEIVAILAGAGSMLGVIVVALQTARRDDLTKLQAILEAQADRLTALEGENKTLRERVRQLETENESLRCELDNMRDQRRGGKRGTD